MWLDPNSSLTFPAIPQPTSPSWLCCPQTLSTHSLDTEWSMNTRKNNFLHHSLKHFYRKGDNISYKKQTLSIQKEKLQKRKKKKKLFPSFCEFQMQLVKLPPCPLKICPGSCKMVLSKLWKSTYWITKFPSMFILCNSAGLATDKSSCLIQVHRLWSMNIHHFSLTYKEMKSIKK